MLSSSKRAINHLRSTCTFRLANVSQFSSTFPDPDNTRRNTDPLRGGRTNAYDESKDASDSIADAVKSGAVGAMEAGVKFGEAAKQTVDGMLDAAKKTTDNVKDSVANDDEDDYDDTRYGRSRTQPFVSRDYGDKHQSNSPDNYVDDIRKKVGAHDLERDR